MIPRSLPSSCGNTQCEWMRGRKCVCDGWLKDGHCEVRQIKKKSPCSRSWSAEFCSSAAGCFTSAIYRGGRNSAVLSFPASLKNTTMLRFIRNETTLAEKIREKKTRQAAVSMFFSAIISSLPPVERGACTHNRFTHTQMRVKGKSFTHAIFNNRRISLGNAHIAGFALLKHLFQSS